MTGVSQHYEGLFALPGNIAAVKNPNQCAFKKIRAAEDKKPGRKNPGFF
jgi:hypothetical protein